MRRLVTPQWTPSQKPFRSQGLREFWMKRDQNMVENGRKGYEQWMLQVMNDLVVE